MKIKSIRIENFRSFRDVTIQLNKYSCFVGPNGAGKSNVLAALNIFFREQAGSATDVNKLTDEDYFCKNTDEPIRITVTFDDLNQVAQDELSAYVRQGELIVTAEAVYEPASNSGAVKHYGQRFVMGDFRPFFEAEKAKASAAELTAIYDQLKTTYPDLPVARSKDDKKAALQDYESAHPGLCQLAPSEDNFYGINSTGKLANFVQWVYVPAVKDAGEEGLEGKNTALGKLIARTVRTRTNFDEELATLKRETLTRYQDLLNQNQAGLTEISEALQRRLESWAHPNVSLGMEWLSDPNKSVSLQAPVAGIKTGEGDFIGSLSRMGHGLQRSYLLALLQELAGSEAENAPTLILGCEEPELYQHPPQARHLAEVFCDLATRNNQILTTTHSPIFVSGEGFENVRLIRRAAGERASSVASSLIFQNLCERIRIARGEDQTRRIEGLVAKIHQALQPGIAEMFFARVPVLVEGMEEVAHLTTELHLSGLWNEFRRLGCHIIPVNGKDKLIQPLAIALELELPVFVIFDADRGCPDRYRHEHERDNRALMTLLGHAGDVFPEANVANSNYVIWSTDLTQAVKDDFPEQDLQRILETTRVNYAQENNLTKNQLFIAEWLAAARREDLFSTTLRTLCHSIIEFARNEA